MAETKRAGIHGTTHVAESNYIAGIAVAVPGCCILFTAVIDVFSNFALKLGNIIHRHSYALRKAISGTFRLQSVGLAVGYVAGNAP